MKRTIGKVYGSAVRPSATARAPKSDLLRTDALQHPTLRVYPGMRARISSLHWLLGDLWQVPQREGSRGLSRDRPPHARLRSITRAASPPAFDARVLQQRVATFVRTGEVGGGLDDQGSKEPATGIFQKRQQSLRTQSRGDETEAGNTSPLHFRCGGPASPGCHPASVHRSNVASLVLLQCSRPRPCEPLPMADRLGVEAGGGGGVRRVIPHHRTAMANPRSQGSR